MSVSAQSTGDLEENGVHSLYLAQTQTLSLGDLPLGSREIYRPGFQSLFSEKCFSRSDGVVYDSSDEETLPAIPFIRGWGPVILDTRRLPFLDPGERYHAHQYFSFDSRPEILEGAEIFGFSPDIPDHRMSMLYFELAKPPVLKVASNPSPGQGRGRLFLHLYPAGYALLHVVFSFSWRRPAQPEEISQCLTELRPWRSDTKWTWRLGANSGTLAHVVAAFKADLLHSLSARDLLKAKETRWRSTAKIVLIPPRAKTTVDRKDVEIPRCRKATGLLFSADDDGSDEMVVKGPNWDRFISMTKFGTALVFEPVWKAETVHSESLGKGFSFRKTPTSARRALDLFWEVMTFVEFVEIKMAIYEQYAEFLARTRADLKEYRLSLKAKLTKEDVLRLGVYNAEVPRFLSALDRYIRNVDPFRKRIYSGVSRAVGFDRQRERVKKLLEEWETEVAQWEHPATVFWNKIVSPIRSLLAR